MQRICLGPITHAYMYVCIGVAATCRLRVLHVRCGLSRRGDEFIEKLQKWKLNGANEDFKL